MFIKLGIWVLGSLYVHQFSNKLLTSPIIFNVGTALH